MRETGDTRIIRLELLGPARAVGHREKHLDAIIRQPKRLAILTYVVLQEGYVRRDLLLAIGWPEERSGAARRSLTQVLHYLRTHLGDGLLISRGAEEITVSDKFSTDLIDFRRAIRAERFGDALSLYRGELLAGVHVSDSVELAQWLDAERARFRRDAVLAASRHAERLESAGKLQAAEEAARKALDIDPTDESAAQLLIGMLIRSGSRVAAIKAYTEFRDRLLTEYDLEPSIETHELVQLNAGGISPSADIPATPPRATPEKATPGPATAEPAASDAAPRHEPKRWSRAWKAATIGILSVVASWLFLSVIRGRNAPASDGQPFPVSRVAVLYFEPRLSDDDSVGYLADALTEAVIEQLSTAHDIDVISAAGVRRFRRNPAPLDSVANHLSAGTAVTGTVFLADDSVHVRIQIVETATASVRDVIALAHPADRPLELVARSAAAITIGLRKALGRAVETEQWMAGTSNPRAWQLLERGRELQRRAISFVETGRFDEADRVFAGADSLLELAAAEDERWYAPHAVRALIAEESAAVCTARPECRAEEAIMGLETGLRHARRAIDRNSRDPETIVRLGTIHFLLASLVPPAEARGHVSQAEMALREAIARSPRHAAAWSRLSAIQYMAGAFADAHESAIAALEADAFLANRDEILGRLFLTSLHLGRDDDAARWCGEIEATSTSAWPAAFCRLSLLAFAGSTVPDVAVAWSIMREHGYADPVAAAMVPRLELLAAVVIGRTGELDSAIAVIHTAMRKAGPDPDIPPFLAAALLAAGEPDSAAAALQAYVAQNPTTRGAVPRWRWFTALPSPVDPG